MASEYIINNSIDQMLEALPVGSLRKSVGNNLYGINMRQNPTAVPSARDAYGFTFFTKPQLNLSMMNVSNYRGFYNLLTDNAMSYQRYTRLSLDPRLAHMGVINSSRTTERDLKCPFVDHQSAFIPVLTNNIVSLSGWPDLTAPTRTTDAGLYGEEVCMVDGTTNHYESFDIDTTFRNTRGNPLIYMFYIWLKYESLVYEGILTPYTDFILENEIDYQTRIYRLVLDQQKRYVTYIGATGASFPVSVPTGSLFDFNIDNIYNNKNSEINIRFKSMGFTAFEDILKYEFNRTNAIFNPSMQKLLKQDINGGGGDKILRENAVKTYRSPDNDMVKIPYALAMAIDESSLSDNKFYQLNHRAYPWINLSTNELEWWVKASRFRNISATGLLDNAILNNQTEPNTNEGE
jgi:hypothetical protein